MASCKWEWKGKHWEKISGLDDCNVAPGFTPADKDPGEGEYVATTECPSGELLSLRRGEMEIDIPSRPARED
jgi:hypothetical protein